MCAKFYYEENIFRKNVRGKRETESLDINGLAVVMSGAVLGRFIVCMGGVKLSPGCFAVAFDENEMI